MTSIPFTLPDMGLTEVKGLILLDDEFLVFELETALMGEFNKDTHTVKIEPAALQAVYLDHGLVRDQLCIRPKKRDLLDAMPGKYAGELRLKVWRKYRRDAEALVAAVQARK